MVALDRATKAAAREYARRCRESLRTMEWALKAGRLDVAAEQALQAGGGHGAGWRGVYIRAMRELYGVTGVRNEAPAWRLDEKITDALREARGEEAKG